MHKSNNVLTKHAVQVVWHKISAIDPRHPDRNCPCHLSVELLTSNLWLRWITTKSKTKIAMETFGFHTFWHPKAKGETWNINNRDYFDIAQRKGAFYRNLSIKSIYYVLKPLQNKKGQKNLGYPRKKQSFYKGKDCFFLRYPIFLALLTLKRL